jgi:hypothetical protein
MKDYDQSIIQSINQASKQSIKQSIKQSMGCNFRSMLIPVIQHFPLRYTSATEGMEEKGCR